jgi:membrane protease YdiL (CAAX protease family)
MSAFSAWMKRHPLMAYLCLAFGISWLLFLPSLLSTLGIGVLPFEIPLQPFVLLSAVVALTGSAALVTQATSSKAGVKALFAGCVRWRVGVQWYLFALFAMPLACILASTIWLGMAPIHALASKWSLFFTEFLPKALLIAILVSLWEETGWTGFLLPPLQARFGPLLGPVLVNCCQALLHVPLLFIMGGLSDSPITVSEYPTYLLYLFIATIPMRFVMTWIFNGTGGSLLLVALFHAAWNTTAGPDFTGQFAPSTSYEWVYWVLAVVALIIILLTKGQLCYKALTTTATLASGQLVATPTDSAT